MFLWEPEKTNFKFHKNREYAGKFIFSGSHKKFSLVLLQITNNIFSP